MQKIDNYKNIKRIQIYRDIEAYCIIGKQDFKASIKIELIPNIYIPEYIELTTFLDSFNGSKTTIENLISDIKNKIQEEYKPAALKVIVDVDEGKHAAVTVEV